MIQNNANSGLLAIVIMLAAVSEPKSEVEKRAATKFPGRNVTAMRVRIFMNDDS